MTAPRIVDPAGLLGQALSDASPDLQRKLLQTTINSRLSADADSVCAWAEWNAPFAERTNYRNGYRHRPHPCRHSRRRGEQSFARTATSPSNHSSVAIRQSPP